MGLCIFMIEMTLNHFRNISKTRNNMNNLRKSINELKGTTFVQRGGRNRRGGRGRGRGGRDRNSQRGRGRGGRGRGAGRGGRGGYRRYNDDQYAQEDDNVANGNYDEAKDESPASGR